MSILAKTGVDMKVFIGTALYFILPLFFCCAFLECVLQNTPNVYSQKHKYLRQHSNTIESLFLGSSHALYGINPEFISGDSFNAAHVSQTLNFDLAILQQHKGKWKNLKTIVIPIDYFTLFENLEVGVESWRVKNYHLYYGITEYSSFQNHFELLSPHVLKAIYRSLKHYLFAETILTINELGWGTDYHSSKSHDLERSGQIAAQRHTVSNHTLFERNVSYLKEIIAFAKSNNTKVILYTSPVYPSYIRHLDQDQMNKTLQTVSFLDKTNAHVYFYDLMQHKRFIAEDFYDADHLNEKGAQKMSLIINNHLNFINQN